MGMQYKKMPNYVYAVLGDGECDEGQVWEAALFAATKKLGHLIAFVDQNQKQLDGFTKDICDIGDLRRKFEDFAGMHRKWTAMTLPLSSMRLQRQKRRR